MAKNTAALMAGLKFATPPDVIGWSVGAMIAATVAAKNYTSHGREFSSSSADREPFVVVAV
jgi:thioesterase domain-containing protein